MKSEYVAMVIAALATACCAGTIPSVATTAENRFDRNGNRASRATDFQRANTAAPAESGVFPVPDEQQEEADRWKRANDPWDGEHSEFKSFTSYSVWKPPVYQLSRPYFIPIYGSNGRIPIYFAPQPYKPPFIGPAYLPPKEYPVTTEQPTETTMTIKTRFDFDDDDDRPVWDKGTSNNEINHKEYDKPVRPPNQSINPLSVKEEDSLNEIFKTRTTTSSPNRQTRPTHQTRPTRPPQRTRPTPRTTTATTRRPEVGPSNCVWAAVSCCSASTDVYPEACFEQRGCPGPFWGNSPCGTEFAKAAVERVLKYYQTPASK